MFLTPSALPLVLGPDTVNDVLKWCLLPDLTGNRNRKWEPFPFVIKLIFFKLKSVDSVLLLFWLSLFTISALLIDQFKFWPFLLARFCYWDFELLNRQFLNKFQIVIGIHLSHELVLEVNRKQKRLTVIETHVLIHLAKIRDLPQKQ